VTDTPRTDALMQHYFPGSLRYGSVVLWANFARELERELAKANAERDEARTLFCMNHPLVVSGDNEARDVARRHGWDCFAPHANTTDVPVQNGGA
jgi:predicted kinase